MLLLREHRGRGHVIRAGRGQQPDDVLNDRSQGHTEGGHSLGQTMSERWKHPDNATTILIEISPPQRLSAKQPQDMAFGERTSGL